MPKSSSNMCTESCGQELLQKMMDGCDKLPIEICLNGVATSEVWLGLWTSW